MSFVMIMKPHDIKNFLNPFMLANRLVTNGEFIEFIEDGGYENAPLWLSDGWAIIENEKWKAPFYWEKKDGEWWNFTLNGFRKVNPAEPVTHISYYEADAFAAWRDLRLPTEAEWEVASTILITKEILLMKKSIIQHLYKMKKMV